MTSPVPEDLNPFEAPLAEIGDRALDLGADGDAELIRRHHLGRETSVKSIGLLCYLVAAITGLFSGVMALVGVGQLVSGQAPDQPTARFQSLLLLALFAFYGAISGVCLALGFGLRRLQVWARWTAMVLSMLVLLYLLLTASVVLGFLPVPNPGGIAAFLLFFAAILGYVFYLLVTPQAGVVFSPEYRAVIAKTPEIRARTGRLVKIAVGLLIGVILFFTIMAVASRWR